jgi:hypothetical protein
LSTPRGPRTSQRPAGRSRSARPSQRDDDLNLAPRSPLASRARSRALLRVALRAPASQRPRPTGHHQTNGLSPAPPQRRCIRHGALSGVRQYPSPSGSATSTGRRPGRRRSSSGPSPSSTRYLVIAGRSIEDLAQPAACWRVERLEGLVLPGAVGAHEARP